MAQVPVYTRTRTAHFRIAPKGMRLRLSWGSVERTAIMADSTSTAPAPAEEPKQTIAQKVEGLQARKTIATTEMNAAPEGPAKTALQEEIAVIDRKLRWYAGRSSEGKASTKAARPQKAAKAPRQPKAAAPAAPAAAAQPVPAANES